MNKRLILLLLVAIFIGSCAPALVSPTPLSPVTATQTIASSKTPLPTQTAISAATPHSSLQTLGPYLLFTNDRKNFTIMDADGSGQKQFQVPNNGYTDWNFEKAISPDGNWLAYFTGSTEEPYDLTLNLLNLSDGTSHLISKLVASGFPENLEPVTKTIYFAENEEYDIECSKKLECRMSIIISAFKQGIHSLEWSPNGKYLAFVAQIDDPSSDIYIYDIDNKKTQRLTSEIENIDYLTWAPNGEKILYENSIPGTTYVSRYLHIADPRIKSPQNPDSIEGGTFWNGEGWINGNSYLIVSGGEGAPAHNFRYINTDTQQVVTIWKYAAESYFIDTERERIFMLTFPEGLSGLEPEPDAGIYFVTFDGNYIKITDEIYTPLHVQGPQDLYFALQANTSINEWSPLVSIEPNGTITNLPRNIYYSYPPATSPNGKWVIIVHEDGTELYFENLTLLKTWDFYSTKTIWRPDSLGAFLFIDTGMYYLPIPNGEPILIKDCSPEYCPSIDSVWLP